MSDAATSIGFKDPSVLAALLVGCLCAAAAIYQAAGSGGHSYRSPFAGFGGGESSGSYAPSAEGASPAATNGSNPYAVRQQWGHGNSQGQPIPSQLPNQPHGQGQGQGLGQPSVGGQGSAQQAPAAGGYAAPGISAPPPTVLAGGTGGIVAPPPINAAGAADGGIEAPPPEQPAGVDDGGIVAPPPGQ